MGAEVMGLQFLEEIEELISEATIDVDAEEILDEIKPDDHVLQEQMQRIDAVLESCVKESRERRLLENRHAFEQSKLLKAATLRSSRAKKTVGEMIADIAHIMGSGRNIPQGLIVEFRELSQGGSDDDIQQIWENLAELGFFDIDGGE